LTRAYGSDIVLREGVVQVLDEVFPLLAEITAKRIEMNEPAAGTRAVLEALVRDAATSWFRVWRLGSVAASGEIYPFRTFLPYTRDHERYFAKVIDVMERPGSIDVNLNGLLQLAGVKAQQLLEPAMARRLRVVTEVLPSLLGRIATSGVGSSPYKVWRVLWLDAQGVTASKIGRAFGIERDRVWKLRARAYDELARKVDGLNDRLAA
jgi:hypothetical protein